MFNYYSYCPNYTNSFYQIQNTTPIATTVNYPYYHCQNNSSVYYFYQNFRQQQQQKTRENYFLQNFSQQVPGLNLKQANQQKSSNTLLLVEEISQQNCDNQNSTQKISNLQQSAKLKKNKKNSSSKQKQKQKDGNKRKIRGQKRDRAYVAKQYPKQQASINCRYIQKNFELNIINQVFSFLWSEQKSEKFVDKFYKNQIKTILFFEYIKIIRKFCKRYINKQYLKNLCNYQHNHIAYKMVSKNGQKLEYLSIEQFSQCIRYLIFTYLYQLCPQAILTSKKMRRQIWVEHLIKCRLLRRFMFQNLSANDYEKELIHNSRSKLGEFTECKNENSTS